jgi:CRP-like cAMP-binding protein
VSKRRVFGQIQNLLLAALPQEDLQRILPDIEIVSLRPRQLLHKPGEFIEHVYFPGAGFCSIFAVLEDGSTIEAATVGREGVVGLAAIVADTPASIAAMAQSDIDICYRMKACAFRREMDRRGAFHAGVSRYSQALMAFIMQSAGCNAAHSIEQRLARWLLVAQDRMDADEFRMTQEFVAMMLGASRSTISMIAAVLQKAGLIAYRRGRMLILDRQALEAASCACYRAGANFMRGITDPGLATRESGLAG